jgi:tRNA A37 threonylcarbamoyltransferase TsaD
MIKKEVNKKVKILFPGKGLATDNSIMIGMVGYLKYLKKGGKFGNPKNLKAEGNLKL